MKQKRKRKSSPPIAIRWGISFHGVDLGFTKWPPRIMINGEAATIDQATRMFGPLPDGRMYRLGFKFGRLLRWLGW